MKRELRDVLRQIDELERAMASRSRRAWPRWAREIARIDLPAAASGRREARSPSARR